MKENGNGSPIALLSLPSFLPKELWAKGDISEGEEEEEEEEDSSHQVQRTLSYVGERETELSARTMSNGEA